MRFELTEDQQELRAIVRAFCERHGDVEAVRAEALDGAAFATAAWQRIVTEMELPGLAIEAERGGSGASFVELAVVLEELGRCLLPVPYLPTVTAAATIAAAAEPAVAAPLLERIAAGAAAAQEVTGRAHLSAGAAGEVLLVDGEVGHVADAQHAELLVLAARYGHEPVLVAIEAGADGVEIDPRPTLDLTRRQATVRLAGVPAVRLSAPGNGERDLDRARDLHGVALATESVGAATRCLDTTVGYLGERVQFGRPIGSFQALKHRCADLAVALEAARSAAYYAAWAVDGAPEELPVVAPLAEAVCGEALSLIAAESIQLHGGIGFTWEHEAHLYFKRAKASELLSGGWRSRRRLAGARAGILEGQAGL